VVFGMRADGEEGDVVVAAAGQQAFQQPVAELVGGRRVP